jgi:hypothetical protein
MATSWSAEIDALLIELAASLTPPQRAAFEVAARAALAAAGCSGCGAAYRVLAPLQRGYWDPPSDWATNAPVGVGSRKPSKLADGPPIGAEDPRTGARDRNRLRAG